MAATHELELRSLSLFLAVSSMSSYLTLFKLAFLLGSFSSSLAFSIGVLVSAWCMHIAIGTLLGFLHPYIGAGGWFTPVVCRFGICFTAEVVLMWRVMRSGMSRRYDIRMMYDILRLPGPRRR